MNANGTSWMQLASLWARPLSPPPICCAARHKPEYTPHVDCGDFVIVINADKAVLTGNKLDAEVLPSPFRLDWRPEGDQVPHR